MSVADLGIVKYDGEMSPDEIITGAIKTYEESLCHSLDMGSLIARNEIAHKWQVTFFTYVIRETTCWRFVDVSKQAHSLGKSGAIVGARILTRAAIETLSSLVYSISKMEDVVANRITFDEYCDLIHKIFMGSRIDKEYPETINVLTMVKAMDKKHQGILHIFEDLCETAHPSMIGLTDGYTKINRKEMVTSFGNFWEEKFGNQHERALLICMELLEKEYNEEWPKAFQALEKWLVDNDSVLEAKRAEKMKEYSNSPS